LSGVDITILDYDVVSRSNILRQFAFDERDIGKNKAIALKSHVLNKNTSAKIKVVEKKITIPSLIKIMKAGFEIVIDATDNYKTKSDISYCCKKLKIPLICGNVSQSEGSVIFFDNKTTSPCYRCAYPQKEENKSDSDIGVLNSAVTSISSIQASQAMKYLSGQKIRANELFFYDTMEICITSILIQQDKNCNICNTN
jgi:adenylyltransferase/sulfurtransferase